MALHLNKLESPSPKDDMCQVLLKLTQKFWRRRFLISSMYFYYFIIIYPWEWTWPFIWRNLNLLHLTMLCAKFGWNWLLYSREEGENVKRLLTNRPQAIRKAHLSFQCRLANKRPTGLNGHLSIRDSTLTSCQKGSYQQLHHRKNKNQQWHKKASL